MIITICKKIKKSFLLIVPPPVRQALFPSKYIIRKKLIILGKIIEKFILYDRIKLSRKLDYGGTFESEYLP